MRKLVLQTQMSIDGYIADTNGRTNWMLWNWSEEWKWDKALQKYFEDVTGTVDCILLSRRMAEEGFIHHWARMAQQHDNPQSGFAKKITDARKVVFTRVLNDSIWDNTVLAKGDLKNEINTLKRSPGRNLIAYGGATFAASLIQADLVDEFHLVVNPAIIGKGLSMFQDIKDTLSLTLITATPYPCGIVVLVYGRHN
jgi:dihydrofolate reductase